MAGIELLEGRHFLPRQLDLVAAARLERACLRRRKHIPGDPLDRMEPLPPGGVEPRDALEQADGVRVPRAGEELLRGARLHEHPRVHHVDPLAHPGDDAEVVRDQDQRRVLLGDELADRVVVMYAGRVVELADVFTIFNSPRHPYTVGLMNSIARVDVDREYLEPIPGQPPSMIAPPPGCAFHPRCVHSQGRARCRTEVPPLRPFGEGGHLSACHFAEELSEAHVVGIGAEQPA